LGTLLKPNPCSLAWIYALQINNEMPVKKNKKSRATKTIAKILATQPKDKYVLQLFVAGATARSRLAVLRVRQMCEAEPKGSCKLEVIDIYQQPSLARANQIIATPTLIKQLPLPIRRFIGSLANIVGLFTELDLTT